MHRFTSSTRGRVALVFGGIVVLAVVVVALSGGPSATDEYTTWARGQLDNVRTAHEIVGTGLAEASDQITVMLDQEWQRKMGIALDQYHQTATAIREQRDVPPGATDVHRKLVELSAGLDSFATEFAAALDANDGARLSSATATEHRNAGLYEQVRLDLDALP